MTEQSSSQGPVRAPVGRILLVDDEPALLHAVGYSLRREGYTVDAVPDGSAALAAARSTFPDLVVLDVMLPGMDGLQVCRALRSESTVPILLLSARGEEVDRVVGLEMGADDYLTKPFAMRELLARVRAMLRRAQMAPPQPNGRHDGDASVPPATASTMSDGDRSPVLSAGDLVIDPASRRATLKGQRVSLKPKEFELLHYLARHPGVVLSRDSLLRRVWGYDYPVDTRTVDVHVRWLRQKIEVEPSRPRRIETVRGFGYRFVADPDHEPD